MPHVGLMAKRDCWGKAQVSAMTPERGGCRGCRSALPALQESLATQFQPRISRGKQIPILLQHPNHRPGGTAAQAGGRLQTPLAQLRTTLGKYRGCCTRSCLERWVLAPSPQCNSLPGNTRACRAAENQNYRALCLTEAHSLEADPFLAQTRLPAWGARMDTKPTLPGAAHGAPPRLSDCQGVLAAAGRHTEAHACGL